MLRGIIAEDNQYLRENLKEIVTSIGGINIGYCVESGEELLGILKSYEPEVVFLDIGLPGISGIEAAKYIRAHHPFADIIFITSHDQYLAEAIELYATDYIQKPLNVGRLKKTLERIKNTKAGTVIEIQSEDRVVLLRESDIYMVEAFKNKVRIYSKEGMLEANYNLKDFGSMVGDRFFRTSRSYLVNVPKVISAKPCSRSSFELLFSTGSLKAYLSKKLYDEFRLEVKKYSRGNKRGSS